MTLGIYNGWILFSPKVDLIAGRYKENKMSSIQLLPQFIFEYETPKVVTVKNIPMGIIRLLTGKICICFLVFYQLWYSRGYQGFCNVESSLTAKVKGITT